MAGVLGIYGLIIAVIISNEVTTVEEKASSPEMTRDDPR